MVSFEGLECGFVSYSNLYSAMESWHRRGVFLPYMTAPEDFLIPLVWKSLSSSQEEAGSWYINSDEAIQLMDGTMGCIGGWEAGLSVNVEHSGSVCRGNASRLRASHVAVLFASCSISLVRSIHDSF